MLGRVEQKPGTLGGTRFAYSDYHQIHIFAKGSNGKDKRWKMEKDVENILQIRLANPFAGVAFMEIKGPVNSPEEDPTSKVEHSRYDVLLYYQSHGVICRKHACHSEDHSSSNLGDGDA